MVTGGNDGGNGNILDSTELYDPNTERWRMSVPLPSASDRLRASTVDNRVLLFGETTNNMNYLSLLIISMVCT